MKWLGSFIIATGAAAIGTLIALIFEPDIARYFSPDRPIAEIYFNQWEPLFVEGHDPKEVLDAQMIDSYSGEKYSSGEPMSMIKIDLNNPGAKELKDIRIDFGKLTPSSVLEFKTGKLVHRFDNVSSVSLEPLAPGETDRLFVWTIFDYDFAFSYWTWTFYSSEGSAIFHLHANNDEVLGDDWLGSTLGWAAGIFTAMFLIGMLIKIAFSEQYRATLFRDETFYSKEKTRYETDPKKFKPAFEQINWDNKKRS